MAIKNCDGKRIKSCDKCSHFYSDYYFIGCKEGLGHTFEYKAIVGWSFLIPIECRLPDWKRTLEVKID